jgi:hypothetical protein
VTEPEKAAVSGSHESAERAQLFLKVAKVVLDRAKPARESDLPGARPFYSALPTIRDLRDVPEAVECARRHFEDGIIQAPIMSTGEGDPIPNPGFDVCGPYIAVFVLEAVGEAVERAKSLAPTEQQLLETYFEFVASWTSTEIEWRASAPLIRFSSTIERAKLSDIVELRKAATDTLEDMSTRAYLGIHLGSNLALQLSAYELVGAFRVAKRSAVHEQRSEVEVEIKRAITALRLHKPGRVGKLLTRWKTSSKRHDEQGYSSLSTIPVPEVGGDDYRLDEGDVPAIVALLARLKSNETQSSRDLEFALGRFNLCYGRAEADDRVADVAFAVESCLAPGSSERPFRAGILATLLLRKTRNAKEVRTIAAATFEGRNKVVHGSGLTSKRTVQALEKLGVSAQELPDQAEELLRAILKEVLSRRESGESLGQIQEALDKELDTLMASGPAARRLLGAGS